MDWRKCLGCDILMQVFPKTEKPLEGRLYHDDQCRFAHFPKRKNHATDRRFTKNDLTNHILGGVLCLESIPRKENCWVTMWNVVCLNCGESDVFRSTDLRFNPPLGCRACIRKVRRKI